MNRSNPFATLSLTWALCGIVLLVQACSVNPIARAETAEQRLYAVYGTYVILEETVADIVESDSTPTSSRNRLISTVENTRPVILSMVQAYEEYQDVLAEFQANETTEDRLQFAIDNMVGWVTRSESLVDNLRSQLRGER